MTNEQLQNGVKLAEQIKELEVQLLGWKTAEMFSHRCPIFTTLKICGNWIR